MKVRISQTAHTEVILSCLRKHLVFGGPLFMGMSVKVTEEVMGNN